MGVIVVFDYNAWVTRYPEFAVGGAQPVAESLATAYFNEATLYQANNGAGPVRDSTTQSMLLNMLTAHIASLNAAINSAPAPNIVGRINSASEGSVSVGSENLYPPGTPQWYQQTKYGAAWWAATAQFRTMRYRPGPVMGVPANQGNGWWGTRGCS
jgi:hypothetical protein